MGTYCLICSILSKFLEVMAVELQIGLISNLVFDLLIQIMDVIIQFSCIDFTIRFLFSSFCVSHTSIL